MVATNRNHLHRYLTVFLLACWVTLSTSVVSGNSKPGKVTQCDNLAAGPDDPEKVALGVYDRNFNAAGAMISCREALQQNPDSPRLQYQYARALKALGYSKEPVEWFRKAANQGYAIAQFNLGYIYAHGKGVEKSEVEAAIWFRKSAEQGFAKGQAGLGDMLSNGRGVEKNEAEAVMWYRKAAEKGLAVAQFNLANMYSEGRGVEVSKAVALEWYRKAAEQDFVYAQTNMGLLLYSGGAGVEVDKAEAVKWLRKAAEQGQENAIAGLGDWYLERGKEAKNPDESASLFREAMSSYGQAADKGDAYAQVMIGNMYAEGLGVERNPYMARDWYQKAAAQGDEDAKDGLKKLDVDEERRKEEEIQRQKSQQRALDARRADLRSGKTKVSTLQDAQLFYSLPVGDEADGMMVVSPPLRPTGKSHFLVGFLDSVDGNNLIFRVDLRGDVYYFGFSTTPNMLEKYSDVLRIGAYVRLIGKNTGIREYHTVGGSKRYMSMFETQYIERR